MKSKRVQTGELAAWLDALYGNCRSDDGSLVFITPDKKQIHTVGPVGALVELAEVLVTQRNLYLKINPMDADGMRERSIREGKGRHIVGNACEVKTIVSFHLDCDAGKSSKYHSRDEMLWILDRMPHPPSLIVNSDGNAGGFHAYWILRNPHRIVDDADRQRISGAAKRWEQRLNTLANGKLDSTADICRVLRVVGLHRSNGNLVSCHDYWPERLYTLADLTIPEPLPEVTSQAKRGERSRLTSILGPIARDGIAERAAAYVRAMDPSVAGQNGHDRCFAAACVLVLGFDLSADTALDILRTEFNPRCQPEWSDKELRHKVEQADRKPGERGYKIDERQQAE